LISRRIKLNLKTEIERKFALYAGTEHDPTKFQGARPFFTKGSMPNRFSGPVTVFQKWGSF